MAALGGISGWHGHMAVHCETRNATAAAGGGPSGCS